MNHSRVNRSSNLKIILLRSYTESEASFGYGELSCPTAMIDNPRVSLLFAERKSMRSSTGVVLSLSILNGGVLVPMNARFIVSIPSMNKTRRLSSSNVENT